MIKIYLDKQMSDTKLRIPDNISKATLRYGSELWITTRGSTNAQLKIIPRPHKTGWTKKCWH